MLLGSTGTTWILLRSSWPRFMSRISLHNWVITSWVTWVRDSEFGWEWTWKGSVASLLVWRDDCFEGSWQFGGWYVLVCAILYVWWYTSLDASLFPFAADPITSLCHICHHTGVTFCFAGDSHIVMSLQATPSSEQSPPSIVFFSIAWVTFLILYLLLLSIKALVESLSSFVFW